MVMRLRRHWLLTATVLLLVLIWGRTIYIVSSTSDLVVVGAVGSDAGYLTGVVLLLAATVEIVRWVARKLVLRRGSS